MPNLRNQVIHLAHEDEVLRPHLLPLLRKQAGARITRTREGFLVEGGDWPLFVIENITKSPYFPAKRPPSKVGGVATYQVKLRSPDALCLTKGDIEMTWGSPTSLTKAAARAVFDSAGRSLEDFTKLFSRQSKVTVSGGKYLVEYADPGRTPVDGLLQITLGTASMYQKIPLADMKRDGVLEDAAIQIGGTQVGTVLTPKGLPPLLEDLRGLFK